MKKRGHIIPVIVIGLVVIAGIVLLKSGVLHATNYLETRAVNGRNVYEWHSAPTEDIPILAPNNSHKGIVSISGDSPGGGHAYSGWKFDLTDLSAMLLNPEGSKLTDFTLKPDLGSNYSTDGNNVVWVEFPNSTNYTQLKIHNLGTNQTTNIATTGNTPPPVLRSQPTISGQYVAFQAKPNSNSKSCVYIYSIQNSSFTFISQSQFDAGMPKINSNKAVWLDARNDSTTGTDIYGYNITSNSYFTVTTMAGKQSVFEFNGRYVLFTTKTNIDRGTHDKCEGLYLYDTQTSSTSTITTAEILPTINISADSTPTIAWSERISNSHGYYYAIKYQTVGSQNSTYISNINDLTYSQFLCGNECINSQYLGWLKTDVANMTYNPYVFKFSNSTNYSLDETSCDCVALTIDNVYAMWVRNRISDGQEFNICGTVLP